MARPSRSTVTRALSASSVDPDAMTTARPAQRAVVAAVALAVTLLPLNSTMLAVALPDIASDTGGGLAATSWLGTVYVVALAGLSPFARRLGGRPRRRRVVPSGVGAVGAASGAG